MLSCVGCADDMRMVERADRPRFVLKSHHRFRVGHDVRGDELQGHGPFEPKMRRLVDGAHGPGAHQLAKLITQQLRARRAAAPDRIGGKGAFASGVCGAQRACAGVVRALAKKSSVAWRDRGGCGFVHPNLPTLDLSSTNRERTDQSNYRSRA